MSNRLVLLSFCALTAVAAAQSFSNSLPGTFVDISTTGGTALTGASDDSEHNFVSTVGNAYFPAGNIRVGSNGAVASGATAGDIGYVNAALPVSGLPPVGTGGFPAGSAAVLCPFWDDLYPVAANANTTMWWQEAGGVLCIMWKDQGHITAVAGQTITFEVQIFSNPPACGAAIQYLYNDTVFGGTQAAYDNGLDATVGYLTTLSGLTNAQYSYNTANSVTAGTVLSIIAGFTFNITSPGGPGTVQVSIADCGGPSVNYFIPYTFTAGSYPAGWLYGLDIFFVDALAIFNTGYPFVGPLPQTIGPVAGLPSGLQFWMVAIGLTGGMTPTGRFSRQTYVVP